jgi:putative membrane protein
MQQASTLFNEEQQQQVERAVQAAEGLTSCEVVPVVATASGRYDRPEDMVGLWLATLAAAITWYIFPRSLNETGSWEGPSLLVQLPIILLAVVVSFLVGVVLAARTGWLRRLFTPRQQMLEEVSARARETFFDKRIHHTKEATGLLIYLSLFEHMAVVLGDQNVMDQVGQDFLDDLCDQLTKGMREGHATEALCSVIATAGEKLSGPLPCGDQDTNELHDTLVLID